MSKDNTIISDYGSARGYIGEGLRKSAEKVNEALANSPPHSKQGIVVLGAKAALAGGKEYIKAAPHLARGFVDGVMQPNPNDGRQTPNMQIALKIQQDGQAARALQGSIASKGMTSGSLGSGKAGSQAASALKGISSGSSTGTTASSALKGPSASSGKSSGASSSSQSKGGGQGR